MQMTTTNTLNIVVKIIIPTTKAEELSSVSIDGAVVIACVLFKTSMNVLKGTNEDFTRAITMVDSKTIVIRSYGRCGLLSTLS